ncbi:TPA: hypothetical protein GND40_004449 [Salmonella enterica subsp. indica]|uniref:Uncharacterized protein n=2 Tax=Salmonella enterica TaxID=28901 RepID=A0A753E2H5_SALER|nr:hypothetical protein [Salmonella enterica subsp. indica serovar 45:a:e,n,x]HAF7948417.1 hypothetical protein [Salmonella enterica subsp. indica]
MKPVLVASKSPAALPLIGATVLCGLVARIRRNAPPPGKSLVATGRPLRHGKHIS